ncbi:ATP-binding protein [Streptomyces sp. NPDC007901]|uniref:ATP-binding protein n=1 Tax=Streptomyces sp. NPDC007901 TaxID=3364785 RepID=UPI0036E193C2
MALPDVTTSGGPPPELTSSARRVDFVLPAAAASVAEARRRVRRHLGTWHLDSDSRDTAVLVVSELFTNAVLHSNGQAVTCVLAVAEGQLFIQVEDGNTEQTTPKPRHVPVHDEGGRGLMLVEAVSRRWGVSRSEDRGGGWIVWATLDAAPEQRAQLHSQGRYFE